ncbi:MAG TPA: tRNA 2-selenouridine(34) synthase MnmH [Sulfurimonas sp. UBA12504]|nr:MAG: tRNA 2-selenouridine(34) synthase MnmH [Sulfurimonas sp. GWF2_37_8]DAB29944.1 MAG TPA: tRNA 2-selenouridine(34) synthase MnmH [Sulfurimonas sp. UBA12504]
MSLPFVDNFFSIVRENRALLDVRAPIEFVLGAFPNAKNIAILDNEQRRLVGICYKNEGNEAAVKLGKKLVNEKVQAQRVAQWNAFIKQNPDAYLYCFRGGQRSGIAQTWLAEAGITIPRLKGGYKAFRRFLTLNAEDITANINTIIIGGRTGSGKTLLLHKIDNAIDLEGLAKHRGSSFGKHILPQPSQIDFENALSYKILQHQMNGYQNLVIEHESHNIGRLYIPKPIFNNFNKGSLVILHTPLHERIEITYDEYVLHSIREYTEAYQEEGRFQWYKDINAGLDRVQKRLGSERYLKIKALLAQNFEREDDVGHKEWIEILLREYYDPMYDYQLKKSRLPIVFEGNAEKILDFLRDKK